jgi:hypothetical protein
MTNLSHVFSVDSDALFQNALAACFERFFLKSNLKPKENSEKPALFLKKTAFHA